MKIVLGLILIAISFIYLIKNPSQSMMDGLMKKRKKMAEDQNEMSKTDLSISSEETIENPSNEDEYHCSDKE